MSDFDAIDNLLQTAIALQKPPRDTFPWEDNETGEDHVTPERLITKAYENAFLKPPRFAWAPSPAAMYTGINMLRHIQTGQRHKFIEGLVPSSDIDGAARRTVLDAIIDRTVTTTMGGSVASLLNLNLRNEAPKWLVNLTDFLAPHSFVPQTLGPFRNPPGVNEVTVYPARMEIGWPLCLYILSFVPYAHVCWFCLPPVEARLNEDNQLEFMRFRDGYTITIDHTRELPEAEPDMELPALGGEVQEPQRRSVLFAMCAMEKCEGCSGQIVDSVVITTCSCACHQKKELAIASVES